MQPTRRDASPERPEPPVRWIAAFDPGRNVGYALVDADGRLHRRAVLALGEVATLALPAGAEVVIGGGTGRRALREALRARGLAPREVDERDTSLRARELWRRDVPPRGLARLLPPGLRAPAGPIDDYAAWAIALRHLGLEEPGHDATTRAPKGAR